MTVARKNTPRTLALAVLAAALFGGAGAVRADDYAEVSQLLRAGRHAEALARADQYLAGNPKDPQMRFIKGVVQTESGRSNDAIATFTRLTEDYPELPEPYNNLAVLYAGQSQFDKARAALEMAIRTNPSYATAHENLGDVYAKLASQAYSRALQLDAANTAVAPKLALIRDLFSTGGSRAATARPAAVPVAAAPAAAAAPAPAASPRTAAAPAPAAAPVAAVAAAPTATAATPSSVAPEKEVEAAVAAWARAWAAQDMKGYLGAYGKDFDPPGRMTRTAWEKERHARIVGKSEITVDVSDLSVSVEGDKAVAKFRQHYKADRLNIRSTKRLELVRAGDRWAIVRESTGS